MPKIATPNRLVLFSIWSMVLASLLVAAIHGRASTGLSYEAYLPDFLPEATGFTQLETFGDSAIYQVNGTSGEVQSLVTATIGTGYGGPLVVLVNWSLDDRIEAICVPYCHEDRVYWNKLISNDYFDQFVGRSYSDPLQLSEDIDAVSGATVSSNGVAMGVCAGRAVLAEYLGLPYENAAESFKFGLAEIMVLGGFFLVLVMRTVPYFKTRKWPRYLTLAYGIAILGIWLTVPLSLTNIATYLIGYAPHIQTFFVIYIVVFGAIGIAAALGKNYYCLWLCPFAAVQEISHTISGQQFKISSQFERMLANARYLLLFTALFLVLWFRNNSIAIFEPWNVIFSLKGDLIQWIIAIFVVLTSLLIYNFWCRFFCPVGLVLEIILKIRHWMGKVWRIRRLNG